MLIPWHFQPTQGTSLEGSGVQREPSKSFRCLQLKTAQLPGSEMLNAESVGRL